MGYGNLLERVKYRYGEDSDVYMEIKHHLEILDSISGNYDRSAISHINYIPKKVWGDRLVNSASNVKLALKSLDKKQ